MKRRSAKNQEENIIHVIRKRYSGLSQSYKKIAEFMLNNIEKAAYLSIEELAREIGVSNATLIRFAQELGFDGFQGLRRPFVEMIRGIIYPSPKLGFESDEKGAPLLEKVKEEDIRAIERTMDNVPRESFERLVDLVASAKCTYAMGWGLSSFLAEYLAFQLERLSFKAVALTRERRPLIERTLFLGAGDVLIVFDFIGYSAEILEAVEYVHRVKKKVQIVTVTNDPAAHVARFAELSFFCDTLHVMVPLVAPMSLINGIVRGLLSKRPKKTAAAIRKFQKCVAANPCHYYQFNSEHFVLLDGDK